MEGAVRTGRARGAVRRWAPARRSDARSRAPAARPAPVARQRRRDRPPGALERDRRVADQGADRRAVEQRQRAVGDLVGIAALEFAARDAGRDLVGEPRVHAARTAPRPPAAAPGWRTARSHSSTHSTQSSLQRRSGRQALVDHRLQALGVASRPAGRRSRSARRRRARRSSRAPRPAAPRGWRSGSGRARSRRRRPSRSARSGRRRSPRSRSAAQRRRGSARVRPRLAGAALSLRARRLPSAGRQVGADAVGEPGDAAPRGATAARIVAAGRRPCWTLSTRSMSSSSTSVLSRWLAHWTNRVRGPAPAGR